MSLKGVLPREHGAWGVLFVPLLVGLGVSPIFSMESFLILPGTLFLFLARQPILTYFRERRFPREVRTQTPEALRWAFAFACMGGLALVPLLLGGRILLLAFGGAFALLFGLHVALILKRKDRSFIGEQIGVLGLTLTAPMAYYASSMSLGWNAWLLYLLCALYFSGGIFLVKMKVAAHLAKQKIQTLSQRLSFGRATILYQLFLLCALLALIWFGHVPAYALLAFVPSVIQTGFDVAALSPDLELKRTGFTLLFHSVLFGIILVLAMQA